MDKNPHLEGTAEEFIENNMGLAQKIAWGWFKYIQQNENIKFDHDDLLSIAYLGLVKAYRKFDPTKFIGIDGGEIKFSTYAVPVIKGEIMRHIRDLGHTVRKSREGLGPDNIDSLDRSISDDGNKPQTVGEMILVDDLTEEKIVINDFLDRVNPRMREIYKLRELGASQKEVSKIIGLSQVQISRIELKFLDLAREYGGNTEKREGLNVSRDISIENAKRMRNEITSVEQFDSIGTSTVVGKRYGVAQMTAYNHRKYLSGLDVKAMRSQDVTKVESEQIIETWINPELKKFVEQVEQERYEFPILSKEYIEQIKTESKIINIPPDPIEEKWNHIQQEIDELRQLHMKRAKEEFDLQLAQVMGRLAI